jgi:hypothetical protein
VPRRNSVGIPAAQSYLLTPFTLAFIANQDQPVRFSAMLMPCHMKRFVIYAAIPYTANYSDAAQWHPA